MTQKHDMFDLKSALESIVFQSWFVNCQNANLAINLKPITS